MTQVQKRRALQAIVQELLSESCREKAEARCSPCECLPQEQRQKLEQQHPSPLPSDKTRRSCSRSLPRSGFRRLPRPPGCGLMLRPFLLRDGPAILVKHLLSRRPAAAAAPPPPPGPANLVKRLHAGHSVAAAAMLQMLRCSCCCCCSTTSDFAPAPPFPPPRWPMNPGKAFFSRHSAPAPAAAAPPPLPSGPANPVKLLHVRHYASAAAVAAAMLLLLLLLLLPLLLLLLLRLVLLHAGPANLVNRISSQGALLLLLLLPTLCVSPRRIRIEKAACLCITPIRTFVTKARNHEWREEPACLSHCLDLA